MKQFILVFLPLFLILISFKNQAATILVKKTKGNNAIIESSTPLVEGETYIIQTSKKLSDGDDSNSQTANSFSIGMDSSFFKSDQLQEHQILIEGRYGWNLTDYEYGPLVKIHLLDEGAGFNSEYMLGGYFDYNLEPNNSRERYFYGLTAQAFAGNREFTSGSSAQIFGLGGGGFLSWYLPHSSVVLRTEGLVENKTIATASKSSNVLGFVAKILFAYYY